MADLFKIGGVLPAFKLAELAKVIREEELCSIHDIGDSDKLTVTMLREWLGRRDHPKPLWLHGGELTRGGFLTLERWLWTHQMSYLRHSDACCDIDAEIVGYIDGSHVRYAANNGGDIMVHASDVIQVREALRKGRVFDAMDVLQRILPPGSGEPEVPPFMVERARDRRRR